MNKLLKGEGQEDTSGSFCPRFNKCNAALCPVLGGRHVQGEKSCFYLREIVKEGGSDRIRPFLEEETLKRVTRVAGDLLDSLNPADGCLKRILQGAQKTPSSSLKGGRKTNVQLAHV